MNYNKLPFKERKRHLKYQFEQTERQDQKLLEKEIKRMMNEKLKAIRENNLSDKEEQEAEALKFLEKVNGAGVIE